MKKSWKVLSLLLIFPVGGLRRRQERRRACRSSMRPPLLEESKSADSGTTLVPVLPKGRLPERLVVKRAVRVWWQIRQKRCTL